LIEAVVEEHFIGNHSESVLAAKVVQQLPLVRVHERARGIIGMNHDHTTVLGVTAFCSDGKSICQP